MKTHKYLLVGVLAIVLALFVGACEEEKEVPYVEENWSSADLPRGGRLYDEWWKVNDGTEPTTDHAAYPTVGQKSGADTWRCKECHGWDYKGKDGAYASGSHYTGLKGVYDARNSDKTDVFDQIKSGTDHDFGTVLSNDDVLNLTKLVIDGLIDDSQYIDYNTKAAKGDSAKGKTLYEDTSASGGQCITCHGADGTQINFGDQESPEYVGTVAYDNPWEGLHKIRFGQPGTTMPSTVENGLSTDDAVDILTYAQTLPTE